MILTCPSCSASYNVPNEAIGPDGRQVRCKKCKHEWFQEGGKKALEDLINLIQSTDIDVDDIAFDDGKKKPKLAKPEKERVGIKTKLAVLLRKILPPHLKNRFFPDGYKGLLSHFASFMVALAVFTCLLLGLVSARWSITRAVPALASVYEAAGFPLTVYARLNPEDAFTIDRVLLQSEGGKREIVGHLINITNQNVRVPELKLTYLGDGGKVIEEVNHALPLDALGKEGVYNFNISVPDSIPETVGAIKISFTE